MSKTQTHTLGPQVGDEQGRTTYATFETAGGPQRALWPGEQEQMRQRFTRDFAGNPAGNVSQRHTFADSNDPADHLAFLRSVQLPDNPTPQATPSSYSRRPTLPALSFTERADYARELNEFARTGNRGPLLTKFATITSNTAGGALVPKEVAPPIVPPTVNAFRAAHELHGVLPVETETTGFFTMPVFDATAGTVVAENATAETENEPVMTGSMNLNVRTYQSGTAYFSNLLVDAVGFDLATNLIPSLNLVNEVRLEIEIATALIADANITQVVTTAGTGALAYADLVKLNNKLPKRFGIQKAIVLSQAAYEAAEGLVDTAGQPILQRDPKVPEVMRFNGSLVLRCDTFEAFGAAKTIGAIFSLFGFRIRDTKARNLARYELPNKPNQIGFNLFNYFGFGWAPAAVAKLKTP